MADSNWRWILIFFVRADDVTPENKAVFAAIFSDNGSGETYENEAKLFDSVLRLSVSGELPAQVFGIVVPVKPVMREALEDFIETVPQSRYYGVRNLVLNGNQFVGQLLKTNDAIEPLVVPGEPPWDTTPFTLQDALDDLYADRGLQLIENG
jgi:hypothetical protein